MAESWRPTATDLPRIRGLGLVSAAESGPLGARFLLRILREVVSHVELLDVLAGAWKSPESGLSFGLGF